jgi:malate dehydrogenase
VAIASDGSYDIPAGLICSFPVRSDGSKLEIVQGVPIDDFSRQKIDASVAELQEEKEMVSDLLPS